MLALFAKRHRTYCAPGGVSYALPRAVLAEAHTLIAGATGSGKSVLLADVLREIVLTRHPTPSAGGAELFLVDPKRVDLWPWAGFPHVTLHGGYACEPAEISALLSRVVRLMEARYDEMRARGLLKWDGAAVYVVIDELADLMLTYRKQCLPDLVRLLNLGRAAGVHVIAATQAPARAVLPAELVLNFSARVGLRCASAIESRQAIGQAGAETLPRHGVALVRTADGVHRWAVPYVPDAAAECRKAWASAN